MRLSIIITQVACVLALIGIVWTSSLEAHKEPVKPEKINLGIMVDMNQIPIAFNEDIKCQVKTDVGVYIVRGHCIGEFGKPVYVYEQYKERWFYIHIE